MKIHFPKFLKVIITLFSVWFGLSLAKFLSFDFALSLHLFFFAFLIPFSLDILMEAIFNRKFLWEAVRSQSIKKKAETDNRAKLIQERIIRLSSLFSGGPGKTVALIISYFISFVFALADLIKKTLFSKYNFLAFSFFGILFEIMYLPVSVDWIVIFLTLVWWLTTCLFRFKGEVSVKIALFLLIFCPYFLSRNQNLLAERFAVWVFMFLVVGVLEMAWEGRKQIDSSL